ncbi:bifunctional diaminohydroxyphosphoribosylaminopyrimidine deaminase/5-amino-6-(5-phosphoribosylamino)uracil reductase RibD [Evansella cellulosilytica]|uniref:Riboflavin biosynthesis protein RibD n=1 Tax=Evansella cellulosilytica (strain ATCC 21833 / DSM 2522 / FERM P-1141 / JCM 9156 / N-4) TaxID=649639 RepID=E6TYL5_EVAC2|nr:bifunctional diaminohydroxyphosphoribosylaminopyrimidine deaminase/5-amino-6-(5-phosphoribosylamino)uracil reductase RibD [Evansella cellulosilytica]ADU30065.1 riboflavin biosynthesis protein RibD [Evansella cellulosilytica DSM 2522]
MDNKYMKMAIELAKVTEGHTTPNPVVGAVIVNNNQIVGFGAHLKAGEHHAEKHAIEMAKDKTEGATIYVTLEPCSHYGRTPPCADAVIEAGIKKVIIGSVDPNPKVSGRGIKKLEDAGIEVEVGCMKEETDKLNDVFFHFVNTKKPFVTLKSATSLDGKIATRTGESQWITSEESRKDVHQLRHKNDAILVGINTVIKDDPALTTRLPDGGKNPIRVILDRELRIPMTAKLINDHASLTWVITTRLANKEKIDLLRDKGTKVLILDDDKIEISSLLYLLGEHNITSLLVEGGGTVNDSFLKSGEFQQVIVYIAPLLIGGEDALSSFSGSGIEKLADAKKLKVQSLEQIGNDIKLVLTKGEED